MRTDVQLKTLAVGLVTPFYRRLQRGRWVDEYLPQLRNRIVYEGADLLALALVGEQFVTGMYFQYTNGTPGETTVPPERRATYYHTTGSIAPRGFTRVPLLGRAEYASTDVLKYNGNMVTVVAISDSTPIVPVAGNEIQDNVTQFVGAGLVYLATDYANDKLFSSVAFAFETGVPAAILKLPNAQVGLRWDIIFQAPGDSSSSSGDGSSSG